MECPICNSERVSIYLKDVPIVTLYKIKSKKLYTHYMCADCNTLFIYPIPNTKEFDSVYNNPEYYLSWERNLARNLQIRYGNDLKKYKVFINKIPLNNRIIDKPTRIIELGCALGNFLYWTMPHFTEVYGVEYSDYAIKHSINPNFRISKEFFNKFPANFFDVICSWDVFEHVPNIEDYIKESNRILKPGGKIILTTPNSKSISFKLFKDKWIDIAPPEHVLIYSKKSLEMLFRKYGFKNIKIQCSSRYSLNPILPIYTIFTWFLGTKPTKQMDKDYEKFRKRDSLSFFKRVIYSSYYGLASIVSWPINKLGYGDSLLLVAQK